MDNEVQNQLMEKYGNTKILMIATDVTNDKSFEGKNYEFNIRIIKTINTIFRCISTNNKKIWKN